jgi:hypothetical protein
MSTLSEVKYQRIWHDCDLFSMITDVWDFPKKIDWLKPLRKWLNDLIIDNAKLAHRICRLVPPQCPFERDVVFFGRKIWHIPPLCKINPLYEEVVSLRFRALCYLADECGEDISCYC